MVTSAADVTVSWEDAFTEPVDASIDTLPVDLEVASPVELTAAMLGSEVTQVTMSVTSRVVWSVKVPLAFSCVEVPSASEQADGVTAMATMAAFETVRETELATLLTLAEIIEVPTESDVA
jgi:hypothetical protein